MSDPATGFRLRGTSINIGRIMRRRRRVVIQKFVAGSVKFAKGALVSWRVWRDDSGYGVDGVLIVNISGGYDRIGDEGQPTSGNYVYLMIQILHDRLQ